MLQPRAKVLHKKAKLEPEGAAGTSSVRSSPFSPPSQQELPVPQQMGTSPLPCISVQLRGVEPASVLDRHLPPQSHSSPPVDRPTVRPQHTHSDSATLGRPTLLTRPVLPYWQCSPCRWGEDLHGITGGFLLWKRSLVPFGERDYFTSGLWIVQERSMEELKGLDGHK